MNNEQTARATQCWVTIYFFVSLQMSTIWCYWQMCIFVGRLLSSILVITSDFETKTFENQWKIWKLVVCQVGGWGLVAECWKHLENHNLLPQSQFRIWKGNRMSNEQWTFIEGDHCNHSAFIFFRQCPSRQSFENGEKHFVAVFFSPHVWPFF